MEDAGTGIAVLNPGVSSGRDTRCALLALSAAHEKENNNNNDSYTYGTLHVAVAGRVRIHSVMFNLKKKKHIAS